MSIARKAPLKRTGYLKRGKRPRPYNAKRRAAEFERAYGSPERVAFVKSLPCVVADCRSPRGAQQNMHIRGDGFGRKADADAVIPCCPAHHQESHNVGIKSWAAKYRLNPTQLAVDTDALWQRRQKELAVEAAFEKRRFWESLGGLVP